MSPRRGFSTPRHLSEGSRRCRHGARRLHERPGRPARPRTARNADVRWAGTSSVARRRARSPAPRHTRRHRASPRGPPVRASPRASPRTGHGATDVALHPPHPTPPTDAPGAARPASGVPWRHASARPPRDPWVATGLDRRGLLHRPSCDRSFRSRGPPPLRSPSARPPVRWPRPRLVGESILCQFQRAKERAAASRQRL